MWSRVITAATAVQSDATSSDERGLRRAAWLVVGLWLPYAALNTLFPGPAVTYALGLLGAACALVLLWRTGSGPRACFVRVAALSRSGAAILGVLSLYIPAVLLAGRGKGFDLLGDLVYAPASALGQELYFRSALLVALLRLCRSRPWLALSIDALLFGLWHVRAFRVIAWAPALGVVLATALAGLLWSLQVRRDRTMVYAFALHTLFLLVH